MRMMLLLISVLVLQVITSAVAINLARSDDEDFAGALLSRGGLKALNGVTLTLSLPVLIYVLDLLRYHAMLIRMQTTTYRYMAGKK